MNQLALLLDQKVSSFAPTHLINEQLERPIIKYLIFKLDKGEVNYDPEEVILLLEFCIDNIIKDPYSLEFHKDLARILSLITYHLEGVICDDDYAEIISMPFLNLLRARLEILSNEILTKLYVEEDYASEEMANNYKNLRKVLEKFNFDMDGELIPLVDPIFVRYSEILMFEDPVYLANSELLIDKRPAEFTDEKEYLAYLLFE